MQSERVHAYYLRDLGYLLRERAEEAARESRSIRARRAPHERLEDFHVYRDLI
jgi:hypothetical protein